MDDRYTFLDLFSKPVDLDAAQQVTINKIIVPKIQRPYAQGRKDGVSTFVRENLLKELFLTLNQDEVFDLNFIYGIVRAESDKYNMELLDGQQRLTTLFLFYWYITNRELDFDSEEAKGIRKLLHCFQYETRDTSSIFCSHLVDYRADLSSDSPSKILRNSKWYYKSFDKDSTVCSMLTMLDAIHSHYEKQPSRDIHTKLQNIRFYVKSLGRYNLSDELYIKMNARGLQLSPFENFKADLTNFIDNAGYDEFSEEVVVNEEDDGERLAFKEMFSVNLDAKWVDVFWKKGADDFDASYMSFFTRFFSCQYITATTDSIPDKFMQTNSVLNELYTKSEENIGSIEYLGFQVFNNFLTTHPESIITLNKVLNVLHKYDYTDSLKEIQRSFVPVWEQGTRDYEDFFCNTRTKMNQTKLIILGAFIEFVDAYDSFDLTLYKEWMRVVWNIVENTNIDGLIPVASTLRKLSRIIQHIAGQKVSSVKDFYTALSTWTYDGNENRAVVEEVEKACRISNNITWLDTFSTAENHPFFKGMVLFFYDKDMSIEQFNFSLEKAKEMLDANGITKLYRQEHILIRAIVSQYSTWADINEQYFTEVSESNKYLKNKLASNGKVRKLFNSICKLQTTEQIKAALKEEISNAAEPQAWYDASTEDKNGFAKAIHRMRNDISLYDWVRHEESGNSKCHFRIKYFEGHIMFSVPKKWFMKLVLDSTRSEMADILSSQYSFKYSDSNQKAMYSKYHDCYGNNITLTREINGVLITIDFGLWHKITTRLAFKNQETAAEYLPKFTGGHLKKDEERIICLPDLRHNSDPTNNGNLKKTVESIISALTPEEA